MSTLTSLSSSPLAVRLEEIRAAYPAASDAVMTAVRQVGWLLEVCSERGIKLDADEVFLGNERSRSVEVHLMTPVVPVLQRHVGVSLEVYEPKDGDPPLPTLSADLVAHYDEDDGTGTPGPTALLLYVCFVADGHGTTGWRLVCDADVDGDATEVQRRFASDLGFAIDGTVEVSHEEARRVVGLMLDEYRVVAATAESQTRAAE